MKRLLIILICCVVSLAAAEKQPENWDFSGRLDMYIQSIDVAGGSDSSREGSTHNEELNLNFTGPLAKGTAGVQTRLRTTNDDNIQPHGAELLYLRSFYKDDIWEVEAGDVALSLNPYIFSGSMKGIKAVYKSPEKEKTWDFAFATGAQTATWRDLLEDGGYENPTNYMGAFEAKYIHERAQEIAFSVAAYDTDLSTVDTNTTTGKRGYGVGVDSKWRFNKYITLKGRAALTDGKDDVRTDTKNTSSKALYLKLLTRPVLQSVKSDFTYQRVDSDFVSFGGSANNDKEMIENSTTWTINKEWNLRADLKTSRDNLDGEATNGTQRIYYEGITLNYAPEFLKRANISFRATNKDTKDDTQKSNLQTTGVDFTWRQANGWRYGGGYDYTNQDDTTTETQTHILKALLGYNKKLDDVRSYRFTFRPEYQIVESEQNKIGLKLDAGYEHDKHLSFDLGYLVHVTDYESNNDTQNSTYQFRTTYKVDVKGRNVIRLLLEKRDVDVEDSATTSYNEYIGKLSFVSNF